MLACSESSLVAVTSDGVGQLQADTEQLHFGVVDAGDVETRRLLLHNIGDGPLQLEGIEVPESAGFTLTGGSDVLELSPGGQVELDISWLPLTARASEELVIWSDDPSRAALHVSLVGLAAVPELHIDPETIELGAVDAGCEPERDVWLENVGLAPLTLYDATLTGHPGLSLYAPELPLALEPGEGVYVGASLATSTPASVAGSLTVISDEPMGSRSAPLEARVTLGDPVREAHAMRDTDNRLDVLLVVDGSDSMVDHLAQLEEHLPRFTERLSAHGVDWQLGLVTSDTGCLQPPLVVAGDPVDAALGRRLLSGPSGFWSESLLTLASLAVDDAVLGAGDCNEGLLREDTPLLVVAFSDEPDQSYSSYTHYLDRLNLAVDGEVTFSAVAGDVPGGCDRAREGTGYWEATLATDGDFQSICAEDWGRMLEDLAEGGASAARFELVPLMGTPLVRTLRVFVDGVETIAWRYDPALNAIRFDLDALPLPGTGVEVAYRAAEDCG